MVQEFSRVYLLSFLSFSHFPISFSLGTRAVCALRG